MIDYYELINKTIDSEGEKVCQRSKPEILKKAIKEARKKWTIRSNNPDGTIRLESEQHLQDLAEAQRILLDPIKKNEYDQQLIMNTSDTSTSKSKNDWEKDFFNLYNNDLFDNAAQIARDAINRDINDGMAWYYYGEALRSKGDYNEAINALLKAMSLMPKNPDVFRQLGFALVDVEEYNRAYKFFKMGSILSPNDYEFYVLRSMCLRFSGKYSASVQEAEIAFAINDTDNTVRYGLFWALYDDVINAISYNRSSGRHLITNKKQLDYANGILKKMALTIPQDKRGKDCQSAMEEIVKIVVDAENQKGGGLIRASKIGYEYNYEISSSDTRSTGIH